MPRYDLKKIIIDTVRTQLQRQLQPLTHVDVRDEADMFRYGFPSLKLNATKDPDTSQTYFIWGITRWGNDDIVGR